MGGILQAREAIRTGSRAGTQPAIERELRLEAEVQALWPELLDGLVTAFETFNKFSGGGELEIEGDNDDAFEGVIASRAHGVPARAEIKMIRGGVIQCETRWGNIPQGRIVATPADAAEPEGLFRVSSEREEAVNPQPRSDVHVIDLAGYLLADFFRHI